MQLPTTVADSKSVQDLAGVEIDIKSWIAGLTIAKHIELKVMVEAHAKYMMSDNTLRKYATLLNEMVALEAQQNTQKKQIKPTNQIPSNLEVGSHRKHPPTLMLEISNLGVGSTNLYQNNSKTPSNLEVGNLQP